MWVVPPQPLGLLYLNCLQLTQVKGCGAAKTTVRTQQQKSRACSYWRFGSQQWVLLQPVVMLTSGLRMKPTQGEVQRPTLARLPARTETPTCTNSNYQSGYQAAGCSALQNQLAKCPKRILKGTHQRRWGQLLKERRVGPKHLQTNGARQVNRNNDKG